MVGKEVKFPGFATEVEDNFTPVARQVRVDTSRWELRLGDGIRPGGHRILNAEGVEELIATRIARGDSQIHIFDTQADMQAYPDPAEDFVAITRDTEDVFIWTPSLDTSAGSVTSDVAGTWLTINGLIGSIAKLHAVNLIKVSKTQPTTIHQSDTLWDDAGVLKSFNKASGTWVSTSLDYDVLRALLAHNINHEIYTGSIVSTDYYIQLRTGVELYTGNITLDDASTLAYTGGVIITFVASDVYTSTETFKTKFLQIIFDTGNNSGGRFYTRNGTVTTADGVYVTAAVSNWTVYGAQPVIGEVRMIASSTVPTEDASRGYWLYCNGTAISRTTYARLFAKIGTAYGVGDGSTTFNIPDMRGEFIRGFDDGRGVDSGRVFGAAQLDAVQNATGTLAVPSANMVGTGVFADAAASATGVSAGIGGRSTENFSLATSAAMRTATETRARNQTMKMYIRAL